VLAPSEEAQALTLILEISINSILTKKNENKKRISEIETRIVLQRTDIRIFRYSGTALTQRQRCNGCLLIQFVMQKMFIGGDPLLESVNLWEPEVTALREKVSNAMMQGVIPLRAYAAEYEKYLDLHNLDIETLLE